MAHWGKVILEEREVAMVRNGRPLPLRQRGQEGERVRAYSPSEDLLAVLRFKGHLWHPERVFLPRD